MNKIEKYTNFNHKLAKLAHNLINITKMGKTLKLKKFLIIFAKI